MTLHYMAPQAHPLQLSTDLGSIIRHPHQIPAWNWISLSFRLGIYRQCRYP